MKRRIILGSLLVVGTLSIAVAQQAPTPSADALMVTKLKDNLYVLKGGGGNTSVFVTGTGVVVIDSKNPGWGQPILDKIRTLTDKPVTTLINTHTHGDHVSGNVSFPATVDIVVQANTAENMKKMIPNSTAADQTVPAQTIFQQNGNKGLPKRTFKDKMTIGKGADEVDLFYFGRGHTNGDAWVLFPAIRVLHAADIFSGKNIPLLDANNGGRQGVQRVERQVRHDHHRPLERDEAGGPQGIRTVQPRLRFRRAGGGQGGQEPGRCGQQLADSGEVPGLRGDQHAGRQGPRQEQRDPCLERAGKQRYEVNSPV